MEVDAQEALKVKHNQIPPSAAIQNGDIFGQPRPPRYYVKSGKSAKECLVIKSDIAEIFTPYISGVYTL